MQTMEYSYIWMENDTTFGLMHLFEEDLCSDDESDSDEDYGLKSLFGEDPDYWLEDPTIGFNLRIHDPFFGRFFATTPSNASLDIDDHMEDCLFWGIIVIVISMIVILILVPLFCLLSNR